MKKTALTMMIALFMVLAPMTGFAAERSIEGSVQGFTCVTQGITCPVGKEDPMAAVERVFVLLTADNDYYFVPNVDRAVMARHINNRIRVTGNVDSKYKSIAASKIERMDKGSWQKAWSPIDEQDLLRNFEKYYGGPSGAGQ